MGNDSWAFFQAFLRSPRVIASIVPSSMFLERRVVRAVDAEAARVIVEFGAGTGGITRALLAALGPEGRLLAIEKTAEFVARLREIRDSRFEVVHGCASSVGEVLAHRGFESADAIVSGIPFSTIPAALGRDIAAAVYTALVPGGRFVAYQFSPQVVNYLTPLMGDPTVEREIRNVPPMRIYSWRKQGTSDARRTQAAPKALNGKATIDRVIRT